MNEPVFITREWVDALHRRSLEEHGGQDGIRNEHGLEAAYAFHLTENQAFIDGNKRTAITTALTFLDLNGVHTSPIADKSLYDAMIAIADKRLDKAGLAALFRTQLSPS